MGTNVPVADHSYEVIIMTEMNGSNLVHPPNCPNLTVWDEDSCSCINQSTSIINLNQNKRILQKITNIFGQSTNEKKNTPLFYIYDDGTVEKRIILE